MAILIAPHPKECTTIGHTRGGKAENMFKLRGITAIKTHSPIWMISMTTHHCTHLLARIV